MIYHVWKWKVRASKMNWLRSKTEILIPDSSVTIWFEVHLLTCMYLTWTAAVQTRNI